jgi:hypothetical protein
MTEPDEKYDKLYGQLAELIRLTGRLYGVAWAITKSPKLAYDPGFIQNAKECVEAFHEAGWDSITHGYPR